jgi:steroid 5-alpha reductase family enzyme
VSPFFLLGVALVVLCVFMTLVWALSRIINNSGVVDLAWALGFSLIAIIYASVCQIQTLRQWAITAMMVIWSLRLAWHLGIRFCRWYPHEDPRYTALEGKLGKFADEKMLLVFLWQGVVLTLMTAPLAVVVTDPNRNVGMLQFLSFVLWLTALIGESIADAQLNRYVANPENKGKTCQLGLWKYSRHPNYFFEWLGSVAFFIFAADSPFGIWTIVCPILMLHLLLNVTGVKPAEEHSQESRADYKEYQRQTSAFVPWFRRQTS